MNEATIGLLISNAVAIVGAYFVHKQKMATLTTAHTEKIAQLESETAKGKAAASAELQEQIFAVARETVAELRTEVNRLRSEVTRLHSENTRLSDRVEQLERERLNPSQPPEPTDG